jgi:hypothetical protein
MKFIAIPVVACGLIATVLAPAGNASGSPCNRADCVPNITHNVSPGWACVGRDRYIFGVDVGGGTFVCTLADQRVANKWVQAEALVGVRDVGATCYGLQGSAQSPDGIPLICGPQASWTEGLHLDDVYGRGIGTSGGAASTFRP